MQKISDNKSAFGVDCQFVESVCKGAIDYDLALEKYFEDLKNTYPNIIFPELDKEKYRKKSFSKWTFRDI